MSSAITTNLAPGSSRPQRNVSAALIDDAHQHVYEAAIHTPLVRLNYDGPADIYLKLESLHLSALSRFEGHTTPFGFYPKSSGGVEFGL